MDSLEKFAQDKLEKRAKAGLLRQERLMNREPGMTVLTNGKKLLSFADNDYLGLTQDPNAQTAVQKAVREGTGAGASRLITGENPLYYELEEEIAALKGGNAALVFGSGYLANIGVIPALIGKDDIIFIDELSHACLYAGAQLSQAKIIPFQHNNMNALESLLKKSHSHHQHAMVITEGVFSMDGDRSPVRQLSDMAKAHDAWLLVDDAHATGVIEKGRGSGFDKDEAIDVPLQTGTLSKAVGGYGGYLVASRNVVELMRNRARSLVYTTGLPPAVLAANLYGIRYIRNHPEKAEKACENAAYFAKALNLPEPDACIVPLVLGKADDVMKAQETLENYGFHVAAVRPPTVPPNTARLRFSFSATHTKEDIDLLIEVIKKAGII